MRRWTIAVLVLFISLSTGCAELKQLRKDNAAMLTQIEQLNQDNAAMRSQIEQLNQDNQACQEIVQAHQRELKKKASELTAKEVKVKEQSAAFRQMQEAMKAELASQQVALKELEGKLTLTMVEAILFDSGKADVKPEGREALQKVAEVLKNTHDQDVIVAGHTDNVVIRGRLTRVYATNWELSAARAIAVVKLLEADGVDPKILSAAGFGEFRPVADNALPEGRAKNRRMEIILMPKR